MIGLQSVHGQKVRRMRGCSVRKVGMAWMQDKCVYQEDKDNLLLFEESVDSLIEKTYTVWMVTDYELPPGSDGRKSWGNGTRSAWNQKEGEIYRDVSMKLVDDTYIFMERDYSLELYE
jgi:hypothetical protein